MRALVLIMSPFHHSPAANGSRFFSEAAVSDRRVALLFSQDFADGFNRDGTSGNSDDVNVSSQFTPLVGLNPAHQSRGY